MKYIVLYIIVLAGCFTACQKEDSLTPSNINDLFAPDPEATDAESVLRRDFFNATGCYLLFNDTLRHEYKGEDTFGNPYYETELIGLEWNLTSAVSTRYLFEYLKTQEQKKQAVSFLQTHLIPKIKNVLPYSILVINKMDKYILPYEGKKYEYSDSPLVYSNLRCTALNISELWDLTGEESLTKFSQDICCRIIFASWGGDPGNYYQGSKAYDFLKVNNYDYEELKSDYDIPDGLGDEYIEDLYYEGFIENTSERYLPSATEDAAAYIKVCLTMTDEEFRAKFADYKNVIKKYEIIKPLVEATGIQF